MLVVLFLVVQALFSGLAAGARADAAIRSDVICSSASQWSFSSTGQPTDRAHLVDCCTLGCPMLGGAVPGPVALNLPVDTAFVALIGGPSTENYVPDRAELAPLHSRAPPEA